MEEGEKRELQMQSYEPEITAKDRNFRPPLDLSLSMSSALPPTTNPRNEDDVSMKSAQALKQHVAEQVRLAALETAYADQMRELARRELDMAKKEFAQARLIWERAREEMERVDRMKTIATRRIGSTCIEITCRNCRRHFRL
ncbi:hypothetical protein KSP40_PGU011382 [Platanthera guangdongensis]|uniref:Uncharacterized protein n=1 Tax=Platanthera guangdongensis TaxID=2320717 RepID=A0ABR2LCT5_9ASPA